MRHYSSVFVLFCLLFLSSVVLADSGLQVVCPQQKFFLQNRSLTLVFHVFNSSGAVLAGNETDCVLRLFNVSGEKCFERTLDSEGADYVARLNASDVRLDWAGEYPYLVSCNSSKWQGEAGFKSASLVLTWDGRDPALGAGAAWFDAVLPLIFASLFIVGAFLFGTMMPFLKPVFYLLGLLMGAASIWLWVQALTNVADVLKRVDSLTLFLWIIVAVWILLFVIFTIELIRVAFASAEKKRDERLNY